MLNIFALGLRKLSQKDVSSAVVVITTNELRKDVICRETSDKLVVVHMVIITSWQLISLP